MTFQRTGALIAAIALALLGTLGLTAYVHGAKDRATAGEKLVDVYVASGKITAGTPADQLHSKVKLEKVPAKVRATGAVTDLATIKDKVAEIDIADGEQLLATRFVAASVQAAQVQSSTEVPPGFFQSTVSLDPDQALGGQVRAGNRVAVVALDTKASTSDATQPATAKVIARNVLVTTVQIDGDKGQGADQKEQLTNAPTGKFLVTLALTQPDLETVVTAVNNGTVWLAADPGHEMSDLLVASPSEKFGDKIAGAFGDHLNGHRRYWREGLFDSPHSSIVAELTRTNPAVVAIGPDITSAAALDLARAFDAERPDVVVVLVAKPSIKLLENALRAGARDVVAPDSSDEELRVAFDGALHAADRRRGVLSPADVDAPSRHVICVVSPKGGAGKTTVSTNLASSLAMAAPGEVVIVDLDFQFGDVASALRMTPTHTFADISRSQTAVDITTVKVFLTPSDAGLFALCAPETPVEADVITPAQVQHVLTLLASQFRYVIVDTGSGIDEPTIAALELSTDIVVLTSTDVPSVRATRKEIDTLDLLGLTNQSRHFVVNRADARVGLPVGEIEATVGMSAVSTIPSSRLVPISVNQGRPVVVSDRRSGVAEAISRLTARFEAASAPSPGRVAAWRKNKEEQR